MGHGEEHLSSEQQFTMKGTILSLLLVCASALELEDIANVRTGSDGSGRKPKLFFVSSSSTVTTIQTSTFCYVTASPAAPTGLTTCSRKKRRSILKEADDFLPEFEPEPSKTSDVEPSMDESVSERQGKFLDKRSRRVMGQIASLLKQRAHFVVFLSMKRSYASNLRAFSVHNAGTRLVIFLFGDPHFFKGRQ